MISLDKILIVLSLVLLAQQSSCLPNQFLQQGNCQPCMPNCASCINNASCLTCQTQTYLNNSVCLKCSTSNCADCPNNICNLCQNGFSLIKGQCPKEIVQDRNQLIVIFVAFALSFVIGIIGLCLIHHFCCKTKVTAVGVGMNSVEVLDTNKSRSSAAVVNFDWKRVEQGNKWLEKEQCAICLSDKTNVELECHHGFHLQCIGKWLQNHAQCAICRKKAINEGRLYCRKCFVFWVSVNVDRLQDIKQSRLLCSYCQSEEKMNSQVILMNT